MEKVTVTKDAKESRFLVNGELAHSDGNIFLQASFDYDDIIDEPEPWLTVYEMTKEKFEERIAPIKEDIEKFKIAHKKAKENNEKVELYMYTEPCRSRKEQCDIDKVFINVNPDGSIDEERIHTC